jgi:predicted Zn-dependent peptidase
MPHTRSVSVGFYLGVGSRYEPPALGGASHLIEHMVFKGTNKRPTAEQISAEVEGRGGLFNAETGPEYTGYWIKVAEPHLHVAIDVLADMVRFPLFDDEELDKERRVIIEEIGMTYDEPESLVSLLINEIWWPHHSLGRAVAGTRLSVSSISGEELLAFKQRHYSPGSLVISVAGNAQHERVVDLVTEALGDWQGSERQSFDRASNPAPGPSFALGYKDSEQVHIVLRLPGMARNHPDRFALSLMNTILGDGMSSRLFVQLRERLGLAYVVDSTLVYLDDTGVLEAYAATDPDRLEDTIRAILRELVALREARVSDADLRRAKEYTKGRILLGLEDTLSVAAWWGQQELLRDHVLTPDEVVDAVESITPKHIHQVAQGLLSDPVSAIAAVGPLQDEDRMQAMAMEVQQALK